MKLSPDDLVEYLFRLILIASGILTAILLISALTRLLDADAVGLGNGPSVPGQLLPDVSFGSDQQPIQMLLVVLLSFSSRERSRASAFCRITSILAALSSALRAFSAGASGAASFAAGA
jgi:hypothetical protein